jgi:hypothetical protein
MVSDIDDNFLDGADTSNTDDVSDNSPSKGNSLAEKQIQEQAQKNLLARKRIDELKEIKRLKDLLDDSEDW